MKIKRKNLVIFVLISFLFISPTAADAGIKCPSFKYYFDANKNGEYDSEIDKDITNEIPKLKKGNAQYIPLHTIVRAEGSCSGTVNIHWCSNSASREENRSYSHKITVINGKGDLTLEVVYNYETSKLTKEDIINAIKNHTYNSIALEEKDASILENLTIKYVPDFTRGQIETETLEDIIMNQTLTNYCDKDENNCTYELLNTGMGKIYNTTDEFYISWERVFRDLEDKIDLVVADREWVQEGGGEILVDKGEYYVIRIPGFYTLKHTW